MFHQIAMKCSLRSAASLRSTVSIFHSLRKHRRFCGTLPSISDNTSAFGEAAASGCSRQRVEEIYHETVGLVSHDRLSGKVVIVPAAAVTKSVFNVGGRPQKMMHHLTRALRSMFLPTSYPHSVHPSYAAFHWWQSAETFTGSFVGVLCNQAMLATLGLGTAEATGAAVAIQWVLKDSIGEIGKLFFTERYSRTFDANPKAWKVASEAIHMTGNLLQILTAALPAAFFLPLASLGNLARSIAFLVWQSTHIWFTKHFAIQRNIGDLSAKADSQMSLAHVLGMVAGVGAISYSHDTSFLLTTFFLTVPFHMAANVLLIRSAQFQIMNISSCTVIADVFARAGAIPDVESIERSLTWAGTVRRPCQQQLPHIQVGRSIKDVATSLQIVEQTVSVLASENYLLFQNAQGNKQTFSILLHEDGNSVDVAKAVLHAVSWHRLLHTCSAAQMPDINQQLQQSYQETQHHFEAFTESLMGAGWNPEELQFPDSGRRLRWQRPSSTESTSLPT